MNSLNIAKNRPHLYAMQAKNHVLKLYLKEKWQLPVTQLLSHPGTGRNVTVEAVVFRLTVSTPQ